MKMVFAAFRSVAVGVLAAAFLPACTTNPTTGRLQMDMLSRDEEIALGDEAKGPLTEQYGGKVNDPQLQGYVAQVGMAMVPFTEADNPTLPWEFTLLDSDVINAFALPGGKVFMSRGLAEKMTNEAQLASVLGHEIGHVTAQHVDERVSASTGTQILAAGASILVGGDGGWLSQAVPMIVDAGGQGFLLKYGRDQELEADALGIRYMVRAGYDPMGSYQVQSILEEAAAEGRTPEILSTHPYPDRRREQAGRLIEGEYAFTQNNPQYQLYEDRFRSQFLSRLAAYFPAGTEAGTAYAHAAWCSICAEREAAARTPR